MTTPSDFITTLRNSSAEVEALPDTGYVRGWIQYNLYLSNGPDYFVTSLARAEVHPLPLVLRPIYNGKNEPAEWVTLADAKAATLAENIKILEMLS